MAIAWPMIELALAIFVIGLMIWVLGIVAQRNNGQAIDILGFGLIGNRGLLIYTNFIIAVGLVIAGLVIAVRRGALWITATCRHAMMRIPVIGGCLEKLALARLTWALHLTMNVDMDLPQGRAARAAGDRQRLLHPAHAGGRLARRHRVIRSMRRSASRASSRTRFSKRWKWPRRAARWSSRWNGSRSATRTKRRRRSKLLTTIAGVAVALLVMGLIILMIFRIAGFYVGTINDALKMTQ